MNRLILETSDARVREAGMEVRGEGPWHRHSATTETVYCLAGTLRIARRDTPEVQQLQAGDMASIAPGVTHQLANAGHAEVRYLLIHGGGAHDFVREDAAES